MNNRFLARAMALGATAIIGGCAGTDCGHAVDTAGAAAEQRLPLGQWINEVDSSCTGKAERAWAGRLKDECAPLYGFHGARTHNDMPADCSGSKFESARNLGRMLGEMERERAGIRERLEDPSLSDETRRELNRKLVVIERDLPQLEALARMEGYLPPAEVPNPE